MNCEEARRITNEVIEKEKARVEAELLEKQRKEEEALKRDAEFIVGRGYEIVIEKIEAAAKEGKSQIVEEYYGYSMTNVYLLLAKLKEAGFDAKVENATGERIISIDPDEYETYYCKELTVKW